MKLPTAIARKFLNFLAPLLGGILAQGPQVINEHVWAAMCFKSGWNLFFPPFAPEVAKSGWNLFFPPFAPEVFKSGWNLFFPPFAPEVANSPP